MKKNTVNIGSRLLEAITKEQVARLLDIVFSHEDVDRWQEGIRKADPDIAATLDRLLEAEEGCDHSDSDGKTEKKARITLSKGRLRERWRDLWRRWEETIAEVGDEDGRYAVHEHHWKETYFDEVSLSYDLETIAGEMLPLIDDVYALDNEPDLFAMPRRRSRQPSPHIPNGWGSNMKKDVRWGRTPPGVSSNGAVWLPGKGRKPGLPCWRWSSA